MQLPTNKGANGCRFIVIVLLAFGGCQRRVRSRQRRAGQSQKESIKPLANRQHHYPQERCFSRAGCHIGRIPSAEQEWAFVTPLPDLPAASAAQAGGAARLLTLRLATGRRQPRDGRAHP